MKVICISGKAGHGKDTTAKFLKEALEADGYRVLVTHYADLLKHICKSFFGWDGKKDEYGRDLLQHIGTDVIRGNDPNYWVNFVIGILKMFPNKWDYVLIPDCRFLNEVYEVMRAGFEVIHVRVGRDRFMSPLSEKQQAHPSEMALDDAFVDYYIRNNGTLEDLRNAVSEFLVDLNEQHQTTLWEREV